ncbi:hypothetical protein TruAng_008652 [Truncatella angustata]|nr:hypothetical protein TruAng_008652 [Truncatella angustata]
MSAPGSEAGSQMGAKDGFIPLIAVVDFHHARGPEVEKWFGVPEGADPAADYDWGLLPFMALSDGAHASTEDFSYFTLLRPAVGDSPATSLFGISCTRQMDASQLLNRPPEVTRSTVQKAVVVIADSPQYFGMLRERLSMVTSAWFAQREFTDCEILQGFQESLKEEKERGQLNEEEDRDQYLGMSLRELVPQDAVLWVAMRKIVHDAIFSDISDTRSFEELAGLCRPRAGRGSLFGPYTPLQQLDILADFGTKSYIVGSTNSLLLQQKDRYSDILINLDDDTINITSSSLRSALSLSASDRRWIDFITQEVNDTWDEKNPGRPNHMGYRGSEEFIRLQFEEYLLALISSVKYHSYLKQNGNNPKLMLPHVEGDPSIDFGTEWVDYWSKTENYRIWNAHTDSLLFDIIEPKHPCAGGLTVDDVQRRIQQQVQDLHLDERFAAGKEIVGRNAAAAREKASTMFNKFYADMEAMREAQRKRAEESRAVPTGTQKNDTSVPNVDATKAQQTTNSVGAKAGAYIGSWASWAGEKRKQGWGSRSTSGTSGTSTGGGWGFGGRKSRIIDSGSERNGSPLTSPRMSSSGFSADERYQTLNSKGSKEAGLDDRPASHHSFSEDILDAAGSDISSSPTSPRKPKLEHTASPAHISTEAKPLSGSKGIDEVVSAESIAIGDVTKVTNSTKTEAQAS